MMDFTRIYNNELFTDIQVTLKRDVESLMHRLHRVILAASDSAILGHLAYTPEPNVVLGLSNTMDTYVVLRCILFFYGIMPKVTYTNVAAYTAAAKFLDSQMLCRWLSQLELHEPAVDMIKAIECGSATLPWEEFCADIVNRGFKAAVEPFMIADYTGYERIFDSMMFDTSINVATLCARRINGMCSELEFDYLMKKLINKAPPNSLFTLMARLPYLRDNIVCKIVAGNMPLSTHAHIQAIVAWADAQM